MLSTDRAFIIMDKSDDKHTKTGAHKATDGESKHKSKNRPSVDTLRSSPLATTFEATEATDVRHSQWCVLFGQLCDYKVQFGHCRVPRKYSANRTLGLWVTAQRHNLNLQKEGKPSRMTPERMRALQSVGFVSDAYENVWNESFEQLREFKLQSGHCRVPRRYDANPKLGLWVMKQRKYFKLHQEGTPSNSMTPEHMRALQSVGFVSDIHAASWNERFEQLREFKVQFDHTRVPRKYSANRKLGVWVMKQRQYFRLHQEGEPSYMTEERIRKLESIEFAWL
jgi:hypothetical protein